MEHVLHAPRAGTVRRLAVREGQQVAQGALVAELDGGEGPADSKP
jgi:pyruvate/2-oxoglutarate dehydrogenase complex dihydrolipoamide acyltransferase (E2) component